ncbi:MAG: hypothetical protein HN548_03775 [Opitutae bacterium]|jgi:hypothetical protein|nr:hypothetical protein [Opitutae bacterium]MBT5716792.1 hypothetical protein [Opitutae bacterium]
MNENQKVEKPLDDLLSLRGKPFADWKEERKYLRDKWGMQGRQVTKEEIEFENQTSIRANPKDIKK